LKKVDTGEDKKDQRRDKTKRQEGAKINKMKNYDSAMKKSHVVYEEELISEELLEKKTQELMVNRGRKGSDKRVVVQQLEYLCRAARKHGPRKEIPLLMHLIAAIFESHKNIDDYVDVQKWATCHRSLTRIVEALLANKDLSLGVAPLSDVTEQIQALQLNADFIKKEIEEDSEVVKPVDPNVIKVVGSLEAFLLRLEVEYKKSLQQINPHTHVSMHHPATLEHHSAISLFFVNCTMHDALT
jgi:translation initiation factor 3 subunit C